MFKWLFSFALWSHLVITVLTNLSKLIKIDSQEILKLICLPYSPQEQQLVPSTIIFLHFAISKISKTPHFLALEECLSSVSISKAQFIFILCQYFGLCLISLMELMLTINYLQNFCFRCVFLLCIRLFVVNSIRYFVSFIHSYSHSYFQVMSTFLVEFILLVFLRDTFLYWFWPRFLNLNIWLNFLSESYIWIEQWEKWRE